MELPEKLRNGPDEQRVFLLVGGGEEPRVRVLPDTPSAKALVAALDAYHPFWVDKMANRITGFVLMPDASVLKPLWSAGFPAADEAILAVAGATSAEAVYSHAKVSSQGFVTPPSRSLSLCVCWLLLMCGGGGEARVRVCVSA